MPLQDFLLPLENVKFQSKTLVDYANKKYKVVFTDKRFILYAQRGHFIKSDDQSVSVWIDLTGSNIRKRD